MSFTKIYLHCVFATKNREKILKSENDIRIQNYIKSIFEDSSRDCHVLAINNVQDHIHILFSLNPKYSISKLIQEVKGLSSKFINDNHLCDKKFSRWKWYWCFSYAESQIDTVKKYIKNQKEHHKQYDFEKEYKDILDKFHVNYDEKYLFD